MRPAAWLAVAASAAALAACTPPPPAGPATRLYAVDLAGAAKLCQAAKPNLAAGRETATTLTVGNDGGWCAITVADGGQPYGVGLLTARPAHGHVYVHTVGDATRIDYTPLPGYAGPDSFTVKLVPGDAALRVAVTVTK